MGRRVVVQTQTAALQLLVDQMPFHFRDPQGSALADYLARTARLEARYAPDVIKRHFAVAEVRRDRALDQLGSVTLRYSCAVGVTTCVSGGCVGEMAAAMRAPSLALFEESRT